MKNLPMTFFLNRYEALNILENVLYLFNIRINYKNKS